MTGVQHAVREPPVEGRVARVQRPRRRRRPVDPPRRRPARSRPDRPCSAASPPRRHPWCSPAHLRRRRVHHDHRHGAARIRRPSPATSCDGRNVIELDGEPRGGAGLSVIGGEHGGERTRSSRSVPCCRWIAPGHVGPVCPGDWAGDGQRAGALLGAAPRRSARSRSRWCARAPATATTPACSPPSAASACSSGSCCRGCSPNCVFTAIFDAPRSARACRCPAWSANMLRLLGVRHPGAVPRRRADRLRGAVHPIERQHRRCWSSTCAVLGGVPLLCAVRGDHAARVALRRGPQVAGPAVVVAVRCACILFTLLSRPT